MSAIRRETLRRENEDLRKRLEAQDEETGELRVRLKKGEESESEVKKRIDTLVEFLESLPVLKDGN